MMKWSTATAFTIVALALIGNDASGYKLFNKADGSNIICDLDPSCRDLNEDEIATLRSVFNDSIDYSQVHVFERAPLAYILNFTSEHDVGASAALGSAIFLKNLYEESSKLKQREIIVHEGTHIWQYQNNIPRGEEPDASEDPYHAYLYNLDEHERFEDFGTEQQAMIVEHYHRQKRWVETFDAAGILGEQMDYCDALADYEAMLAPVLNIEHSQTCAKIKAPSPKI
jgi:hypothetical protein